MSAADQIAVVSGARIRDLSNEEFFARYHCDRLTATVLSNRYRYTVQHVCTGLLQQAFSTILRDWYDFAASISGPRELDYPMPAVSNSLMLFLGTMSEAVRNTVEEFGHQRVQAGDVLIGNDPYRIGTHVNDVCFIRPVMLDGHTEPLCFITVRAHLADMGGTVPAGFSGTKRNIFENGLVLSPRLLYREDRPCMETWHLLFDNTRFPELLTPDIAAIHQCLLLGERLLQETVSRYGAAAFHGAMRYSCDASAETMVAALGELPDGVYEGEDVMDCDAVDGSEEYRVHAKVTVRGSRAEVDFSGSSRQARTSINASWLDSKSGVSIALMFLLAPNASFTSGALRDVDIVLPEGTLISARPPYGVTMLFFETVVVIVNALFRALAGALGERAVGGDFGSASVHSANGVHEDGRAWVSTSQLGGEHGPWAGTIAGDGDSYTVFYPANNMDPPVEVIEADYPVVVLRKEYLGDTAGAGAHRGGAAVVHDTCFESDAEHLSMPLHFRKPSGFGVWNGADGETGGVWLWEQTEDSTARLLPGLDRDAYVGATPVAGTLDPESLMPSRAGEYFSFARVPLWHTSPGAVFRYITNGGGGWGNPLNRDVDAVLRDVRDEYITQQHARDLYGVVIVGDPQRDPEGLRIDDAATGLLRGRKSRPTDVGREG